MAERSVAVRLKPPGAVTVASWMNASVAPSTVFSDTDAATSTVNPGLGWKALAEVGSVPEAATVTANTEALRSALRATASAPVSRPLATYDSVVRSRVLMLKAPARATATTLRAARLSEPVTAMMRVSLPLARLRSPPARLMPAPTTELRVTSVTSLTPTAPATPTDTGYGLVFLVRKAADVWSAATPVTDVPTTLPVLRASRFRPAASISAAPRNAVVSRVTRLTAALAPMPTSPAMSTEPATLT